MGFPISQTDRQTDRKYQADKGLYEGTEGYCIYKYLTAF